MKYWIQGNALLPFRWLDKRMDMKILEENKSRRASKVFPSGEIGWIGLLLTLLFSGSDEVLQSLDPVVKKFYFP